MTRDVEFKDRAGKIYHISKNLELSEYTGFKDRLGKKIYENDVIEFNNTWDDEYGDPHIERRRQIMAGAQIRSARERLARRFAQGLRGMFPCTPTGRRPRLQMERSAGPAERDFAACRA